VRDMMVNENLETATHGEVASSSDNVSKLAMERRGGCD
jgi:hypothetical protein